MSTTVNILSNSIAGSTASSVSTYCAGGSTTLGISGGALSQDANWNWYSGSCGSNYLASGNPIIANPTITTTFWVRAAGILQYYNMFKYNSRSLSSFRRSRFNNFNSIYHLPRFSFPVIFFRWIDRKKRRLVLVC